MRILYLRSAWDTQQIWLCSVRMKPSSTGTSQDPLGHSFIWENQVLKDGVVHTPGPASVGLLLFELPKADFSKQQRPYASH